MSEATEQTIIEIDDCWNHIGVWGTEKPRCPKLDDVVHCRNCEVYSSAGRQMLDRRLPEGYENNWAMVYAESKQQSITGTEAITIFRLGEEWMALPTDYIQEITDVCTVHSIPHHAAAELRGLVNLRGQLRICFSLGSLMNIEKAETYSGKETKERIYERMIAITHQNSQYVFLVSEVKGTHRYHPKQLKEPPSTLSQATGTFTLGIIEWEGLEVACLDSELLFYNLEKKLA